MTPGQVKTVPCPSRWHLLLVVFLTGCSQGTVVCGPCAPPVSAELSGVPSTDPLELCLSGTGCVAIHAPQGPQNQGYDVCPSEEHPSVSASCTRRDDGSVIVFWHSLTAKEVEGQVVTATLKTGVSVSAPLVFKGAEGVCDCDSARATLTAPQ
jgi:hypothetical protein